MIDWLLPSMAYIASIGALGITTKFALRTLSWQALIIFTAFAYLATSIILVFFGIGLGSGPGIAWAIFAGVLAVGGLVAFNVALERGPASVVVPITAAYPLVATLLAVAVLSERITLARAAGMAMVVLGVVILSRVKPGQ